MKKIFFPVFFGVLFVFLIFLAISNFRIYQARGTLDSEIERLEKEIEKLQQEKGGLEAEISRSQLPDYLEKIAREEFNLRKEEERVVAFPILPEENKEVKAEEGEKSFWQKILEGLKIR